MKPFRKPFFGDPLFPFEMNYKSVKKQNDELPDHLHDRYELVYVYQGKGTFFIDNTWYEKKNGDLFIIPGNTIHHSLPDNDDPIVSSALYFAPTLFTSDSLDDSYSSLLCYDVSRKNKSYRLELKDPLKSMAEEAMDHMVIEMNERKPGYHEAIRLIMCQFLLQINRFVLTGNDSPNESLRMAPAWMAAALEQIDEHPELDFSLSRLAEHANVSTSHFSRVFRQLTTMNVTNYINTKRIIRAKEMLLHSNVTINVISDQCGYDTPTHFYRVFKSLTGVTPNKYRKNTHEYHL
ncbi:AraC family transcriptional regulator [Paenibacillus donghaensis]|uniref:AraC family transcriptional regulator n=1 Tax=Paenibacillus donghaensis TaxID=414771 RepID=A0A2Z2KHD9_9BACL|nr:AraC family transcriptional regulator [Paenibacillus donghaensis]ASA23495.1 AraC family transcriptional regulator [Paenibacillus donghaensis]